MWREIQTGETHIPDRHASIANSPQLVVLLLLQKLHSEGLIKRQTALDVQFMPFVHVQLLHTNRREQVVLINNNRLICYVYLPQILNTNKCKYAKK